MSSQISLGVRLKNVVYLGIMKLFRIAVAVLGLSSVIQAADVPVGERSFIDLETGVLGKIRADSDHDYVLVPTMLSWRSKEMFGYTFDNGSRLLLRHRFTLIAQAFVEGPESVYGGFSASPSLEYWEPEAKWSIFAGAGGGLGWLDHQDVPGAFGQSLTLNWFGRLGVSFNVTETMEFRMAAMFQHMSNGGMTDPNPGLDALGGTVGLTWRF